MPRARATRLDADRIAAIVGTVACGLVGGLAWFATAPTPGWAVARPWVVTGCWIAPFVAVILARSIGVDRARIIRCAVGASISGAAAAWFLLSGRHDESAALAGVALSFAAVPVGDWRHRALARRRRRRMAQLAAAAALQPSALLTTTR